jgi:hypothetical protein
MLVMISPQLFYTIVAKSPMIASFSIKTDLHLIKMTELNYYQVSFPNLIELDLLYFPDINS